MESKVRASFLPVLITYAVVVTAIALVAVAMGLPTKIWIPVGVAAAQIWLFFIRLYVAHVPRTSPGLMGFTLGIFGATMYSVWQSRQLGEASVGPLLAFVALAGWAAYVMWYSELKRDGARLKVGKKLIPLQFKTLEGQTITSAEWEGGKRLLVFYRGNWCPICKAQIVELAQFAEAFKKRGVAISVISPQPAARSVLLSQQVHGKLEFLVDENNQAAQALGLLQRGAVPSVFVPLGYLPDAPQPTAILIDAKRQVQWADLTDNYRLRPRPEDILAELDDKSTAK